MKPFELIACYSADTTGVEEGVDEPISIALSVLKRSGQQLDEISRLDALREPGDPITKRATEVHGLTAQDVAGSRVNFTSLGQILRNTDVIVSWQPEFDRAMLLPVMTPPVAGAWCPMRIDLARHGEPPGWAATGVSRARLRVDHMARSLATVHQGELWLDFVLARRSERKAVEFDYIVEGNAMFDKGFHAGLDKANVGDWFVLWTSPDLDRIHGYAKGTGGGQGLAFSLLKAANPEIAKRMARGECLEALLLDAIGPRRIIEIDLD